MANAAFKHVEQLLSDYPLYPREISKRKMALAYPLRPVDENIGGSHVSSSSSAQERYVVTLDQDRRLIALETQYLTISDCLKLLNDDELRVIQLRYFGKSSRLPWEQVAKGSKYSKSQCLRIRDELVTNIGRKLGMMD